MNSPEFPVVTALTSEQLDLALGRSNVIHAALLAGPASKTFLSRSQILVRYRMADDDKTAGHAAKNSDGQDYFETATRPCGHARRNKIRTAEWLIRKRLATRH